MNLQRARYNFIDTRRTRATRFVSGASLYQFAPNALVLQGSALSAQRKLLRRPQYTPHKNKWNSERPAL